MIDKPYFIMIFMYLASFSVLGAQYFADSFGITLTAPDGTELRPAVLDIVDINNINEVTSNVVNAQSQENSTLGPVDNAFGIGYYAGWQLFQLLTGTYIFNLISLFGVPALYIAPIVIIYVFMIGIWLIAKIRGL